MIITTRVTDISPAQASLVPPDPVGLAALPFTRGVAFYWSLDVSIKPYHWEYRTQVASRGWSTWKNTLYPVVMRTLTDAEWLAEQPSALICIEVRSANSGHTVYSATAEEEDTCLLLGCSGADMGDECIGEPSLNSDLVSRIFSTSAMNLDECTEHGTAFFAGESGADITATHTSADTTLVGGIPAATVKSGAASGALANAKLTTDGVQTGGLTIESTTGAQTKVDNRLSAAEKVNLAADKTITGGFSLYNTNNKPSKSDVGLSNVDNKSSATIRGEIVDGDLAGTTAILVADLPTEINALVDEIVSEAIEDLDAEKVTTDNMGAPTALFDSDGNLDFGAIAGVGVKSGASIRTPANIIAVVGSDGKAKNLDLSSLDAGSDLDDIPDGATYFRTTANEKTGAARGFAGLDAAGQITVGSVVTPVAQMDSAVAAGRVIWSAEQADTVLVSAVTSPSADLAEWHYRYRSGDDVLTLVCEAFSTTGAVKLNLWMETLAGVLLDIGDLVTITSLAYDGTTWEIALEDISLLTLTDGTLYRLHLDASVAGAVSCKGGMIEVTQ